MKAYIKLILGLLFITGCLTQNTAAQYDGALADSLGADEYGMKTYMMVILKTGTNRTTDEKALDSLFSGHMANINRLAQIGKLVVAGPFGNNDGNYRGIFILDVKTREEAQALLHSDPTIRANIFQAEVLEWYGSAALPTYLKVHERIEKQKH